jgi:hypothetical protein
VAPSISAVSASAPKPFQVVLNWQAAAGSKPLGTYTIFRDNSWLTYGQAADGMYVDTTVAPGQRYTYAITVFDAATGKSPPATVTVRTPAAPVRLARLEGDYDVRLTRTSMVGVNGFPARNTAAWHLRPYCAKGPCTTQLRVLQGDAFRDPLTLHGKAYSGSDRVRAVMECGHTGMASTSVVTVHPVRGRVVDGTWTATVLAGTVTMTAAAQLGCRSGSITYAVRATLVP